MDSAGERKGAAESPTVRAVMVAYPPPAHTCQQYPLSVPKLPRRSPCLNPRLTRSRKATNGTQHLGSSLRLKGDGL